MAFKTPKVLLAVAAALGLAGAPAVTMPISGPGPAQEAPANPAAKTDARSTRYYVPKGMQSKKSRLTRYLRALWGDRSLPNRFLHRSVAKAAMQGRGRAGEMAQQPVYAIAVRLPDGTTRKYRSTRRSVERAKRVASFTAQVRARATAARVLAASDVPA
jgi:hypothetical protein